MTLLPGSFTDDIHFHLWHAPLRPVTQKPALCRLSPTELQKTLPKGWTAVETSQYQYRYLFEEDETSKTSWHHPDSSIDPSVYSPLVENPPAGFTPEYEALSYTWGSIANPEAAHALDEYHSKQSIFKCLQISQSLASALRHLRYGDRSRTMWIDAVCINRDDTDERESQVKRMAEIYRFAQKVVIWLGPESRNSKHAMSTLRYLGSQLETGRNRTRYRSPEAVELDWFAADCELPYATETWEAITDLVHRDYFGRLWIWQETQLANSRAVIVCGLESIPWPRFIRAICALTTKDLPLAALRQRIDQLYPITFESGLASASLLLGTSRTRKCTDPRDKIYGILSIAGPAFSSLVDVSYTKSAGQVYEEVFIAYSNSVQRLDLLPACDSSERRLKCPSWVPDFSVERETHPLQPFQLATSISASNVRRIEIGVIRVTGMIADTVEKIGECAPSDQLHCIPTISRWQTLALQGIPSAGCDEAINSFLRTVRAGYLAERLPRFTDITLPEWRQLYFGKNKQLFRTTDVSWCFKLIRKRVFIVTESGRYGIAPRDTRSSKSTDLHFVKLLFAHMYVPNRPTANLMSGDTICLILGCKSPMVLRRSELGKFSVVGECYVHGLEDGASILGPLPSDYRLRIDKPSSGFESTYSFENLETGVVEQHDPRLGLLSSEWEHCPRERHQDDPHCFGCFRNKVSGEVINYDPRLSPDALRERGVRLQDIDLV